jgi:hypothetical protein
VGGDYKMLSFGSVAAGLVKGDGSDLLRFETVGHSLRLFLNDRLVTSINDAALTSGQTGVWGGYYTGLGQAQKFLLDNFRAEEMVLPTVSLPFQDDFTQANGSLLSLSWQERSGGFRIQDNRLQTDGSALSLATVSQVAARDLSIQASIVLGNGGLQYGGLVSRYTDAGNLYVAEMVAYQGSYAGYIFKVKNGAWTLLAYGTVNAGEIKGNGDDLLRFETAGTSLKLYFNDQKLAEATDNDPALATGLSGLWGGPNFTLDNFRVQKKL